MTARIFFSLLLLCTPMVSSAAIYTYIDAQGERVFTDSPPQNQQTETVHIAPANQMPAVPVVKVLKAPPLEQDSPESSRQRYQVLRILTPVPDATIRANDRQLIVTVSSEPALQEGHRYRLILNGEAMGEPSRSPVFPLQNIDRGTHQLAVEILNEYDAILERTPAQPFHLRQTTLSDKRRVRPCADDDYGVRPECPLHDKPTEEKRSLLPFLSR